MRKTILVQPKASWPPMPAGLEMELLESKQGVNYFKFTWGDSTKEAQRAFFMCVQTGDPNTLARVRAPSPSRKLLV